MSLPSVCMARTNTHPGNVCNTASSNALYDRATRPFSSITTSSSVLFAIFRFFLKIITNGSLSLQFCWSGRHCVQISISTMAAVNIAMSEAPSLQQECLFQKGDRIKKIRGGNKDQICGMRGRLRPSSRSRLGPRNECVRRKSSAQDVQG
jgi:hypothetical protein